MDYHLFFPGCRATKRDTHGGDADHSDAFIPAEGAWVGRADASATLYTSLNFPRPPLKQ